MKILIIEDNLELAEGIKAALGYYYVIEIATNGDQAIAYLEDSNFDLVLLDLNLPDINGLDICRIIREQGLNMPILVVTADSTHKRVVELLDVGADDYITKPFKLAELKARVRALLRRQATRSSRPSKITIGDLTLDVDSRLAICRGKKIVLRTKEFIILEQLMLNPDMVLSRAALLNRAWDSSEEVWTNNVDVHIKNIRDKIDKPFGTQHIQTVHGLGYRIISPKKYNKKPK